MKSEPYTCPKCLTEEGQRAYSLLIFGGVQKPCAICGGPLVPVKPPKPNRD